MSFMPHHAARTRGDLELRHACVCPFVIAVGPALFVLKDLPKSIKRERSMSFTSDSRQTKLHEDIISQPERLTTEMDGSSGPRARYSTGDWRNSCIQVNLFQFSKGKEGHLGWSSQSLLECFLSLFESISPSSSFGQVLIIASPSINLLHCLFVRILHHLPPPPIFQIPRHFSPIS